MPIYTPLRFRISPSPRNPKKKKLLPPPPTDVSGPRRTASAPPRRPPQPTPCRHVGRAHFAAAGPARPTGSPRGPSPHRRPRARPRSPAPPPSPTPVAGAAACRLPAAARLFPRGRPRPPPPPAVPLAAREHRRAARLHAGAAPAASSPTGGRVSGELRLRLLQCSGAASVSVRSQISDPTPPLTFVQKP